MDRRDVSVPRRQVIDCPDQEHFRCSYPIVSSISPSQVHSEITTSSITYCKLHVAFPNARSAICAPQGGLVALSESNSQLSFVRCHTLPGRSGPAQTHRVQPHSLRPNAKITEETSL